jgi:hypothetical protein
MASAEIQMKMTGADRYRAVSRKLKKAAGGKELQRKLTKAVRKEGGPALAATRAAWLAVDVKSLPPNDRGGKGRPDTSTGLRSRVARATGISVTQHGIAIKVSGRRVDPKYPSLVYYLNGFPRKRDWRHMVFGHKTVWVAQKGQEVFAPTLRGFSPQWRQGCEDAMDEFVDEIDHGL